MAVDPVCHMTVEPGAAAASAVFHGQAFYFCSDGCHDRFMSDPAAFANAPPEHNAPHACAVSHQQAVSGGDRAGLAIAAVSGFTGTGALLGLYFGVLALVSGWSFTLDQFAEYWPFIVALAVGFGIQVGLFVYLRRAVRAATSAKVVAATGTTSGAAMVSCCTHYLVNLAPAVGATGLLTFVSEYQTELFWFGIAANLAGIAYIGRRVVSFAHGG